MLVSQICFAAAYAKQKCLQAVFKGARLNSTAVHAAGSENV